MAGFGGKKKDFRNGCWHPIILSGGKRWIRTTEVEDDRFTVCSLWPLGNLPML